MSFGPGPGQHRDESEVAQGPGHAAVEVLGGSGLDDPRQLSVREGDRELFVSSRGLELQGWVCGETPAPHEPAGEAPPGGQHPGTRGGRLLLGDED